MLRALLAFATIGALTASLLPFQWLAVRFALGWRRGIPVLFHRAVCAALGVRIHQVGRKFDQHPLLIVANHVSWLDISVITALAPVVFVAKQEVAGWPLFGLLARLQRTVFVDRARRQNTRAVNAEIAQRLTEGDPVVLFGEGTSSDGNRVLPFRSALIGATHDVLAGAGHARGIWIQPMSIAYTTIHGLPLGRQHRPQVAWYGDAALSPHLIGIGRRGAIDVVVSWGEPVSVDQGSDRKALARALEAEVRRLTARTLRLGPPSRQGGSIPFCGKTG
jgi:lyso-ornithine lipid O-acyltransferase